MEQFINSWYLQNEIVSRLGKDDSGVRQKAQQKANDLIGRIKNNSSLVSMALNPLLLTMIATIHAYRGALPGRRVELYAEICDVLLGRRQDAKGIPDALTADQKKIVLQALALNLMERGIREFSPEEENELLEIVQDQLAQVTSDRITALDFLEQIRTISGLLVEKEKGVYSFAHKSFQEYLAAVAITKTNQEQILTENISNLWWQETIRLYSAQSDASNLITAALQENTVSALKLALDCTEEGLSIKPEIRQQLTDKLDKGLESSEPEVFKLAVEVKLAKRLSSLLRIDEERAIDTSYITCAEYQLFVNQLRNSEPSFPGRTANQPVLLIKWSLALDFCGWLSEQANSNLILNQQPDQKYYYRLPNRAEITNHLATENKELKSWLTDEYIAEGVSKGMRLVQTKKQTIFGFDVVKVDNRGQEIGRQHRYAKYVTEKLGNEINLDMVYVPGGKFLMGTDDQEIERLCQKYNKEYFRAEKPQHQVTVQPFLIGKYPVTQAQYQQVMGTNPSRFKGDDDERPVERVSWNDVIEFCRRLSVRTGKEYRLPTEAEWEYAARAGTTSPFHFGETITGELANYDASSIYAEEPSGEYREKTTAVGSFPPNAFGLYDMHGNVWEWCEDDWHDNYQNAPTDGSAWLGDLHVNRRSARQFSWRKMSQNWIERLLKQESLSKLSSAKVIRGGSWINNPNNCRSAVRLDNNPEVVSYAFGFRLVCSVPRTT
ncbi:MAG: SUMF1/EgtB/PvdO family nonheme iron enzyme [Cyanobacteria bacterium P01_F01_bin.143]